MRPKLSSLRSTLIRMHGALIDIDDCLWEIDSEAPLNKFELMVLVLEDHRFFEHFGWDWKSTVREIIRFSTGRKHGGASTIDMQLFRTISNRYERTFRRKIREIIGSVILQRRLSKKEILRIYLNVAYFGTGLGGAKQGAKSMFPTKFPEDSYWVDLSDLDLREAAELASLLVYPKPRVVNMNWSAKVRRRADYGLTLYTRHKQKLEELSR